MEKILEYMMLLNPNLEAEKTIFIIDSAIDSILSYCNITSLPIQLERPIAKYLSDNLGKVDGIESITEGDTSIKYTLENSNGIVDALRTSLFRYKRVGVIK
ncbi:MAG: hypothetical protein ACRC6E_03985 [Fusobacteriaceae bacterium]